MPGLIRLSFTILDGGYLCEINFKNIKMKITTFENRLISEGYLNLECLIFIVTVKPESDD